MPACANLKISCASLILHVEAMLRAAHGSHSESQKPHCAMGCWKSCASIVAVRDARSRVSSIDGAEHGSAEEARGSVETLPIEVGAAGRAFAAAGRLAEDLSPPQGPPAARSAPEVPVQAPVSTPKQASSLRAVKIAGQLSLPAKRAGEQLMEGELGGPSLSQPLLATSAGNLPAATPAAKAGRAVRGQTLVQSPYKNLPQAATPASPFKSASQDAGSLKAPAPTAAAAAAAAAAHSQQPAGRQAGTPADSSRAAQKGLAANPSSESLSLVDTDSLSLSYRLSARKQFEEFKKIPPEDLASAVISSSLTSDMSPYHPKPPKKGGDPLTPHMKRLWLPDSQPGKWKKPLTIYTNSSEGQSMLRQMKEAQDKARSERSLSQQSLSQQATPSQQEATPAQPAAGSSGQQEGAEPGSGQQNGQVGEKTVRAGALLQQRDSWDDTDNTPSSSAGQAMATSFRDGQASL